MVSALPTRAGDVDDRLVDDHDELRPRQQGQPPRSSRAPWRGLGAWRGAPRMGGRGFRRCGSQAPSDRPTLQGGGVTGGGPGPPVCGGSGLSAGLALEFVAVGGDGVGPAERWASAPVADVAAGDTAVVVAAADHVDHPPAGVQVRQCRPSITAPGVSGSGCRPQHRQVGRHRLRGGHRPAGARGGHGCAAPGGHLGGVAVGPVGSVAAAPDRDRPGPGGAGVGFRSLQAAIDTTTPWGRLVFHIFGSLEEFERDLIRERTMAGPAAARRRGRVGGRPTVMTAAKSKQATRMVTAGAHRPRSPRCSGSAAPPCTATSRPPDPSVNGLEGVFSRAGPPGRWRRSARRGAGASTPCSRRARRRRRRTRRAGWRGRPALARRRGSWSRPNGRSGRR